MVGVYDMHSLIPVILLLSGVPINPGDVFYSPGLAQSLAALMHADLRNLVAGLIPKAPRSLSGMKLRSLSVPGPASGLNAGL